MLGCTGTAFITDLKEELFSLLIGSAAFLQSKPPNLVERNHRQFSQNDTTESGVADKIQQAGI